MSEIEFQFVAEPPPREYGRNRLYSEFAEALRNRPGEWAIWPREMKNKTVASVTAMNVRRGKLANFPEGEFESRAAQGVVYVRFVGDQS